MTKITLLNVFTYFLSHDKIPNISLNKRLSYKILPPGKIVGMVIKKYLSKAHFFQNVAINIFFYGAKQIYES